MTVSRSERIFTPKQIAGLRKTGRCMVHGSHRPEPLVCVFHHIIPREWQSKWQPGAKGIRGLVWAPDCVQVCPTGHSNIHVHIRAIISELQLLPLDRSGIDLWRYVTMEYKGRTREQKVAKQAFLNWSTVGGDWRILIPSSGRH